MRMRRTLVHGLLTGFILLLIAGCGASERSMHRNIYRSNLGVTWQSYVAERIIPMLENRYGYRIRTQQIDFDYILIETEWNARRVYQNEASFGIVAAFDRIIIEARSRGRVSTMTPDEHRPSVSYVFETTYDFAPDIEKRQIEIGMELREYITEIETELKRLLEIRI